MKVRIEDTCKGCGLCVDTYPKLFEMQYRTEKPCIGNYPEIDAIIPLEIEVGFAQVIVDEVPQEYEDDAFQAADDCPVEAIIVE